MKNEPPDGSPATGHRRAFSLVELMVVITILSLIVLVLMAVFNSTQTAFRAGVTQSGVLEGSRAVMNLMTSDLKLMTPSGGTNGGFTVWGENLFAGDNNTSAALNYTPLTQPLPPNTTPNTGPSFTNLLNYFFFLTRQNTQWIGIGYVVNATNGSPLYPLYRYYAVTNISQSPVGMFNGFYNIINTGQWTNTAMSHLIDGVVDLQLRVYDPNGYQMFSTNQYNAGLFTSYTNVLVTTNNLGYNPTYYFYSNTVPASVEIEMGVLEDRALQRAESRAQLDSQGRPLPPSPVNSAPQWNYLQGQSGRVHIFRQRVNIPNLDPTAYQ